MARRRHVVQDVWLGMHEEDGRMVPNTPPALFKGWRASAQELKWYVGQKNYRPLRAVPTNSIQVNRLRLERPDLFGQGVVGRMA
jgi:hypothetical protein